LRVDAFSCFVLMLGRDDSSTDKTKQAPQ